MSPICGRLPLSRSPPQPKTTTSAPPAGELAHGVQELLERVRLVRVVDDDGRSVDSADALEPPAHRLQVADSCLDRRDAGCRPTSAAPIAPSQL